MHIVNSQFFLCVMTKLSKWGKDCRWVYGTMRCTATDLLAGFATFFKMTWAYSCRTGVTTTVDQPVAHGYLWYLL